MTRAPRTALAVASLLVVLAWLGSVRVRMRYDEGVYAQTTRLLADGHPLVSDVFTSQPPLWPYLALPGWLGGGVTGTRLWIMCWALLGLVAVYATARVFTGSGLALLTAVLTGAVPAYSSNALAIEAELPALALATLALALALRPGRSAPRLLLVGVLLGAALMVKLLLVPMVVVILLAVVRGAGDRRRVVRDLAAVASAAAVVVVVTGAAFWHGGRLWDQAIGFHAASQGLLAGVRSNVGTALLAPGTCIFLLLGALAGVEVVHRRRLDLLLPVVWLAVTLGFLLLHSPLFVHHLVLAVPPAALLLVLELEARFASRPAVLHSALTTLVAACLVGSAADDLSASPRDTARTNAAVAALERLPSDTVLVTDDQVLATEAGRLVLGPLVDTSDVRISSGNLTPTEVCADIERAGAVLLTRGGRFGLLPAVGQCTRAAMQIGWSDANATLYVRP